MGNFQFTVFSAATHFYKASIHAYGRNQPVTNVALAFWPGCCRSCNTCRFSTSTSRWNTTLHLLHFN